MNVLSRYHPIPLFFYFLSVVLMTAFAVHPVLHLISLIGAFLLICLNRPGKDAAKSALRCLILIAATGILNPIFSHDGVTVLFFLQNNPVTLESILFGVFLGVRICGVLLWCSAFEVILTGDKIAYLLSRLSERSSLLFSMTLRFIPLYLSEWKKLRSAQKTLGLFQTDGVFDRLRAHLALFSALISRSLERAMETASALRARGYGVKKRTLLFPVRFERKDAIFSMFCLFFAGGMLFFLLNGAYSYSFYPELSAVPFGIRSVCAGASACLFFLLPTLLETMETMLWKSYRSSI